MISRQDNPPNGGEYTGTILKTHRAGDSVLIYILGQTQTQDVSFLRTLTFTLDHTQTQPLHNLMKQLGLCVSLCSRDMTNLPPMGRG